MRRYHQRNLVGSILVGVMLPAIGFLSTGCAPGPTETDATATQQAPTNDIVEFPVHLHDGRTVTCIQLVTKTGGIDCDWGHTK